MGRSTYYAAVGRPESKRAVENRRLKAKIGEVYEGSQKRYGSIKITHMLARQGIKASQGRVLRLMRGMGLRSIVRHKCQKRKRPAGEAERENKLKRQYFMRSAP